MIGREFSFVVGAVLCGIGTTAIAVRPIGKTRIGVVSSTSIVNVVVGHVVNALNVVLFALFAAACCCVNAVVGALACLLSLTKEFCP